MSARIFPLDETVEVNSSEIASAITLNWSLDNTDMTADYISF